MTELFRDPWFRLEREAEETYLVLTRLEEPFVELADLRASTARVIEAIRASGLTRLLFDASGAGPGRNDAEFEAAGQAFRRELSATCSRIAIVVRTAVGKLQVGRLYRGASFQPAVFHNALAARRYLLET